MMVFVVVISVVVLVMMIVMDIWKEKFLETLGKLGIPIHFITKYVDDVLLITSKCERGVRFNGHELTKTPEAEEEDKDLSEEKVTMKLLESIATSQIDFLEFTHEVAEGKNMIPVLDM